MFATVTSRKTRSARFTALLWLVFAASCATTRPGIDLPELASWDVRQATLGSLKDWEFRGRIAVKSGDDGFNAKFTWTQQGDEFRSTVSGPLGIGTVQLAGNDGTMTLTDRDGVETVLSDPEAELYYRYGWTIPVATMRYWALGIPDPVAPAEVELDEAGRLATLEQRQWSVVISRYREQAGQDMPRILTATNPEARVRMVIDDWIFFER